MAHILWDEVELEIKRRKRVSRGVAWCMVATFFLVIIVLAVFTSPDPAFPEETWYYRKAYDYRDAVGLLAAADMSGRGLAVVLRNVGDHVKPHVDGYVKPSGPSSVLLQRIADRADLIQSMVSDFNGYYVRGGRTYFVSLNQTGELREEVGRLFFGQPMDRWTSIPHYLTPDSLCIGRVQAWKIISDGREQAVNAGPFFGMFEQGRCTSLASVGVTGAPFRITGSGGNAVLTLERDGSASLYSLEGRAVRLLNERSGVLNIPADVAVGDGIYVMAYNSISNGSLTGWVVYTDFNRTSVHRLSFPNEFVVAVRGGSPVQVVTVSADGTWFRDGRVKRLFKGSALEVSWDRRLPPEIGIPASRTALLLHVGRGGSMESGVVFYNFMTVWQKLAYVIVQNLQLVLLGHLIPLLRGIFTIATNRRRKPRVYALSLALLLLCSSLIPAGISQENLSLKQAAVEKLNTLEIMLKTADRYVVASYLVRAASARPADPYLVDVAYYAERARLAFLAGDYIAGEWLLTVASQKLKALSSQDPVYMKLHHDSLRRGHEASFLTPFVYESQLKQHMERLAQAEAEAVKALEAAGVRLRLQVVRSSPARCLAVPEPVEQVAATAIPAYEGVCTFLIEKQLYAAMALFGILDNPHAYYAMLVTDLVKDVVLDIVDAARAGKLGAKAVKAFITAEEWRNLVGVPKPMFLLEHFKSIEDGVDRVKLLAKVKEFCRNRPEACGYALIRNADEAEEFLATVSRKVPEIIDSAHYKRFLKNVADRGLEKAFEELTGLPPPPNPTFFALIPHLYLFYVDPDYRIDYMKVMRLETFDEAVVLKAAITANIVGFIWHINTTKAYPPPPLVFIVTATENKHGCEKGYTMHYIVWNITWSFDPAYLRREVVEYDKGVRLTYNRANESVVMLEDTAKCPYGSEEGGMDYDDAIITIRWVGGNRFRIASAGGERTWIVVLTMADRVLMGNDRLLSPGLFYERHEVIVDAPETVVR
ncbi:MAG: hypothetical protein QW734_08835 [Candidatus Bathyarchaeia archaeon]